MESKLGIDNLKKLVGIVAFMANLGDDVGRDTSPSRWAKLLQLVTVFNSLGGMTFAQVGPELKDMDAAERQILLDEIRQDLNLADDKLEAVIEESLSIASDLASLVMRSGALIKAMQA